MINTDNLKAEIVRNRMTQKDMARLIGVTPKTFYDKMSKGVFGSDEIEIMIKALHIQDPMNIFFV
jgi:DNA-binding NtrC family response regulator